MAMTRDDSHLVADQSDVVAFLGRAEAYGLPDAEVERLATHGAYVFLVGERAYKMKRAVRFPFMDFSTLERRAEFCAKELALNRRTTPELYLGLARVTREADGELALDGVGETLEWLVVMRRFEQEMLGDRLAEAGKLTPELLLALADEVAVFHEAAEPVALPTSAEAALAEVVVEILAELVRHPELYAPATRDELEQRTRARLAALAPLLEARAAAGLVRRCHGDLHLRNICVIDGRPRLFDAIEFNESYSCIDVLYDLAFLIMDLEHRGLKAGANLVLNRYLERRSDIEGMAALPLFLSVRAGVRAKITFALAEAQPDPEATRRLLSEGQTYFTAADDYLLPVAPRLVAVGGLSGSGKSRLARVLAPAFGAPPGAIVLRSDVLRKRRFGQAPEEPLGPEAYRPGVSREVYGDLAEQAATALAAGRSVIADAVFARPEERRAIAAVAAEHGVPFQGLWLEAPRRLLLDRVAARRKDASDADAAIVEQQLDYDLGAIDWQRLDAGGTPDEVAAAARALLSLSAA